MCGGTFHLRKKPTRLVIIQTEQLPMSSKGLKIKNKCVKNCLNFFCLVKVFLKVYFKILKMLNNTGRYGFSLSLQALESRILDMFRTSGFNKPNNRTKI